MCYRSFKRVLIVITLTILSYLVLSQITKAQPHPGLIYGETGDVKIKDLSQDGNAEQFGNNKKKMDEAAAGETHNDNFEEDPEEDEEEDSNLEEQMSITEFSGPLKAVPDSFITISKCPVCFGTDMCEELKRAELKIDIPETPTKLNKEGIFFGIFQNKGITIKTYAEGYHFQRYEEFMCKNITSRAHCDIEKEILLSYANSESAVQPDAIKRAYRIAHTKPEDLL